MTTENMILRNQEKASKGKLIVSSILCLMPAFAGGAAISYAAIALPFYMNPDNKSGIIMTQEQATWFVSLNSPMQMVGNLLSGWTMERFGRKRTILMSCVLITLASAILSAAPNYQVLLMGCLLNGSSVGLVRPPICLLMSELSLVRMRGMMGSLNTMTPNAGYLYGLVIGSYVPVHLIPWVIVGPCILFVLLSWYMVESPVWLIKHGRVEEGRSVMSWLRGPDYALEAEIKEIESLVTDAAQEHIISRGTILSRPFLFPLFLVSSMFFFHASVGADDLSYYSLTIFTYPGVSLSPSFIAILMQLAFTAGLLVAPLLMSRVGRRPQVIVGGVCLSLCLFSMGVYHYFSLASIHPFLAYTPLVVLNILGIVFGVGIGPVPYTLTGELFPQHLKSLGCGICIATRYVGAFIWLQAFPYIRDVLGMEGVYWIHCVVALLLSLFAFILLPETRNKTYTELDDIFRSKSDPEKPLTKKPVPKQ